MPKTRLCLFKPAGDPLARACWRPRPCPVHTHDTIERPASPVAQASPAFEPKRLWADGQRTYGYDAYTHPTYAEQKRRFEHLQACLDSGRISRAERSELAQLAKLF